MKAMAARMTLAITFQPAKDRPSTRSAASVQDGPCTVLRSERRLPALVVTPAPPPQLADLPESPFDARVINAHPGANQHHQADKDQKRAADPGGHAERQSAHGKNADRNCVVIGFALQQAHRLGI